MHRLRFKRFIKNKIEAGELSVVSGANYPYRFVFPDQTAKLILEVRQYGSADDASGPWTKPLARQWRLRLA